MPCLQRLIGVYLPLVGAVYRNFEVVSPSGQVRKPIPKPTSGPPRYPSGSDELPQLPGGPAYRAGIVVVLAPRSLDGTLSFCHRGPNRPQGLFFFAHPFEAAIGRFVKLCQ